MIRIRKGLDLPIKGKPEQAVSAGPAVRHVAVLGGEYHGMKPTMAVAEGDPVELGQVLFSDKKTPGVDYTSPAGGRVVQINRGAKRALQSVVIEIAEGDEPARSLPVLDAAQIGSQTRDQAVERLLESGLWTTLRTRPFGRVPAVDAVPEALFVNLMDTSPLAPNPAVILQRHREALAAGLRLLAKLAPKVYLCKQAGVSIEVPDLSNGTVHEFDGPHPAGLPGTHIHFLHPVGPGRSVWTIGYADVLNVGATLLTGRLDVRRTIALGGAPVASPRLLETRVGACVSELVAGHCDTDPRVNRLVSGSVLAGHWAKAHADYLGRLHTQVSVVREDSGRHFLHYLWPGSKRHSVLPAFASALSGEELEFTTTRNGSARAMVPVNAYERVMPLDILPTQLLRALLVGDIESAIALGALELVEEDLALCTYACPGKYEYGVVLRDMLDRIFREG